MQARHYDPEIGRFYSKFVIVQPLTCLRAEPRFAKSKNI